MDALWVDDDWVDDDWGDGPETVLGALFRAVDQRLLAAGCDATWTKEQRVGDALALIERPDADYRLALVDYHYEGQRLEWWDLLRCLERRSVPYIVVSNFVPEAKDDIETNGNGLRWYRGVFPKDASDAQKLCDWLKNFFLAPPFRLVHLTDIHFNASLQGPEADEQEGLLDSLASALNTLKNDAPIEFMVVSGDLAGKSPVDDLAGVRPPMQRLVESALGSEERHRVFVVPGNHDLEWEDYTAKKVSLMPWRGYVEFWRWLYRGSAREKELLAWNEKARDLRLDAKADDLCWHHRRGRLNIVGIASTSPEHRDTGVVSSQQLNFLRKYFHHPREFGEVRIVVIHHNVLGISSMSARDQKGSLRNTEGLVVTLCSTGVDLVLHGHVHTTQVVRYGERRMGPTGLGGYGEFVSIATGTTAGLHPGRDRARSFSLIEIGEGNVHRGSSISVTPYVYNSNDREWIATQPSTI